jgi:riboflavin kinase/FMN adenylyltransferase
MTVGTFDGLHRGHIALLHVLRSIAGEEGLPSVLVTFEPHPLYVVRPEAAPRLLTSRQEKIELLAQTGPDRVVFQRFDAALAALSPEEFVEGILVARLGLARLVIGYDHGFGRDRSGNADTLRAIGRRLGFRVDVVPPVALEGQPVSSSAIRRALSQGRVEEAAAMLGRPYAMRGRVVRGDGRGRALGFPTANLQLFDSSKLVPAAGIYAVRAHVAGSTADALLHLGPRPTFPGATPTVEVHLLDFAGDLYDHVLEVKLCARIRGVEEFANVSSLIRAMERDREAARELLGTAAGACRATDSPLS